MKITVLSILIFMLVAGLAMIQMDANTEDANTENQIQVLRETEMLTTQGLGTCETVVQGAARFGHCAEKSCQSIGWYEVPQEGMSQPLLVELFITQSTIAHNQCGKFSWTTDCVPNMNVPQIPCASGILYYDPDCTVIFGDYTLYTNDVQTVSGCPFEPGSGGGTVVGTSS